MEYPRAPRDINEAQILIDRLQRRYLNANKHNAQRRARRSANTGARTYTISWRLLRLRTQRNFDGGQSDADCLTPQLHQRPSHNGKTDATDPKSVATA